MSVSHRLAGCDPGIKTNIISVGSKLLVEHTLYLLHSGPNRRLLFRGSVEISGNVSPWYHKRVTLIDGVCVG